MNIFEVGYCDWLKKRVNGAGYDELLKAMFKTIYIPGPDNDDNRVEDAINLREEFIDTLRNPGPDLLYAIRSPGPNLLEVLVAFSQRAYDIAGTFAPYNEIGWFWEFVNNLGLRNQSDVHFRKEKACRILRNFGKRGWTKCCTKPIKFHICSPNFPSENWVDKELWYQFMEFLEEKFPVG